MDGEKGRKKDELSFSPFFSPLAWPWSLVKKQREAPRKEAKKTTKLVG
jgi:hypothetical protein